MPGGGRHRDRRSAITVLSARGWTDWAESDIVDQGRWISWLTKCGRLLLVVFLMAAAGALALFLYAAITFPTDRASAWFTGIGVVVAIVALLIAGAAAFFTFPAYRDWWTQQQRHPKIGVRIEASTMANQDDLQHVPQGEVLEVPATASFADILVRVAVVNSGEASVAHGALNIAIPTGSCSINPHDDPRLIHYKFPGSADDSDIVPGKITRVWATAVRDDFPPGIRMYHVLLSRCPSGSRFPLLARVEGPGLTAPVCATVKLSISRRIRRFGRRN